MQRTPDGRPSRVQAWRYLDEHGELMPGAYDRPALLADLAAHFAQRLAVALDGPLEQEPPGPERLRRVLEAWLDLARATTRVRRFVEAEATGRARTLLTHQQRLLVDLVAEDLAVLGAPDPARSARDLLREAAAVADREAVAHRVLRRERDALLGPAEEPRTPVLRLLRMRRRPARARAAAHLPA